MQKNFEKFYQRIKLTKNQRLDAKTKHKEVCKKLHAHYYPETTYNGKTKLLIGSYGKHTNIRPPQDVDVLFIMPEDQFSRYDAYESNGQSQLLQDIRSILKEKYSTTEEIRGWGKVVLVKFSNGTHDVELLPAWEKKDGSFTIPNAEGGGSWENWDPRLEINSINNSDNKTVGLTRFLIRMIKQWKQSHSIKMKSFEVEEFVLSFLSSYECEEGKYPVLVRDFFGNLVTIIDDQRKSFVKTAYNQSGKACDFEVDGKCDEAVLEWKKVFGNDFPSMNLTKEPSCPPSVRYTIVSPDYSKQEEYIEDIVPVKINATVRVSCLVDQNGFRPTMLDRISYLCKYKKLEFRAVTNAVPPYRMKWKVRNFGKEARMSEDLRGEIIDDNGDGKRVEHTKYRGEHYVECYVIKDGICIAKGHVDVPISISQ